MTAYAIVTLKISDPERLAAYRDKAADALARHGGEVLHASKDLIALEGEPALPDMAAVLTFPDRTAAMAWKEDDTLQDIHALRQGSGA
ncbi:MAG: DUF1330 domain-containing protein, partial [Pseudomonadota bacterium]